MTPIERGDLWALVAAHGGDHPDYQGMTDELARLGPEAAEGFAEQLAQALHDIDTPAHFAEIRPYTVGDDSYLYARCAVVAAGKRAFDRVVRRPERFGRFVDRDAEPLLAVAPDAYERATGRPWEYTTRVSYEMRSDDWLSIDVEWPIAEGWPLAYDHVVEAVRRALCADPGRRGHEPLVLVLTPDLEPFAERDPARLLELVIRDVSRALGPVPAVELPRDLPEDYFVAEPPPALPAPLVKRVARQGGLKTSSIVAYYRHNPDAPGAGYWAKRLGLR
ncbi:DUF4240 domain-containing protein [Dactylosporangium sp. CA-139066]|uniref:DUF4240 domain-containing protein n=1 Tax=Dactylosporangium sp. CA-139066 TaxID=3239930 RepID=UPI003D93B45A